MRLPDGWDTWGLVKDDAGRERPDPTDTYYITAYLNSGLVAYDPLCAQVWAMDSRMLVAAREGTMLAYTLGLEVARISCEYVTELGRPTVDPQSRGGYVDQFIEGLEAGGYRGGISHESFASKPGESTRAGYGEMRPTLDNAIDAVRRAIEAQDCTILSPSVLRALMLASVDEEGALQSGPGRRVGPVWCAGRALHVLNQRGPRKRVGRKWEENPIPRLRALARAQAARRGGGPMEDWGS